MCNPPNVVAIITSRDSAGINSATTPHAMKHAPITGTMRTLNVPALTTAAP
jgi:hypothetical protein